MRYLLLGLLILSIIGCDRAGSDIAHDLLLGSEWEQEQALERLENDRAFMNDLHDVLVADGTNQSSGLGNQWCIARDHGIVRGHICVILPVKTEPKPVEKDSYFNKPRVTEPRYKQELYRWVLFRNNRLWQEGSFRESSFFDARQRATDEVLDYFNWNIFRDRKWQQVNRNKWKRVYRNYRLIVERDW